MSYKITPTPNFSKVTKGLGKKYPSLKEDLINLQNNLLENPKLGIALGHGCYKIKIAIKSKGKGKSGGARVITLVQIIDEEIHLVHIYDKSEKDDILENELLKLITEAGL